MQTQNTQLRVTLPVQLQAYLQTKASKFGLSLSAYVKNLIINDVQDVDYPIFQASDGVEKSYKKAIKDRSKAVEVNDIDQYFSNL
ncbi:hypothetical protein KJ909_01120 [Patescibacteria group bacterium]|nr:hypothetical protein [Patescibacteria group bacterium]